MKEKTNLTHPRPAEGHTYSEVLDDAAAAKLAELEKKEKKNRLWAIAGFLTGTVGSLFGLNLPTAIVIGAGVVIACLMIDGGVFGIRRGKYLPPPENPKRDPIVTSPCPSSSGC